MRKALYFLPVLFFLLPSCSDDDSNSGGVGRLDLRPAVSVYVVDKDTPETRATPKNDFSGYYLNFEGTRNFSAPYPADGVMDVQSGNYNLTMASHASMPAPAFDSQYYVGSREITVSPNQSTQVSITLYQGNAGIMFINHPLLAVHGLEPVVTVTSDAGSLEFSGSNRDEAAYFPPGEVTVTLKDAGTNVKVGGASSQTLTLSEKEFWRVTLVPHTLPSTGAVDIGLDIKVMDTPTSSVEYVIGNPKSYRHGEAYVVQKATAPDAVNPVHLVVIGDGFMEEDYWPNGAFDKISDEAVEGFFMIDPYPKYRDYFEVTKIAAYSKERGGTIKNPFSWPPYNPAQRRNTFFSTEMDGGDSTGVQCDTDTVLDFVVENHKDINWDNLKHVTILLVINEEAYAGTCEIHYAGQSICMCPFDTNFKELVAHESSGHGFGRLLDEYRYYSASYPSADSWRIPYVRNGWGADITNGDLEWSFGANVTLSNDPEAVHWKHFIGREGYDGVGLYEGADRYERGIWRPEYNSCMNNNVAYFNAPSREAIVRRITRIAGIEFSYEMFFANETQTTYPFSFAAPSKAQQSGRPPLGPPRFVE